MTLRVPLASSLLLVMMNIFCSGSDAGAGDDANTLKIGFGVARGKATAGADDRNCEMKVELAKVDIKIRFTVL